MKLAGSLEERLIANIVEKENTMIKWHTMIARIASQARTTNSSRKRLKQTAYRAQQVDTPTKSQQQQKTNANIAGKENLQLNSQALQSFIFLSPLAPAQMPTLSQR